MAGSVVAIRLDDGNKIFAEIERPEGGFGEAAFGHGDPGEIDFAQALSRVRSAADELLDTVRNMASKPDSCEIAFGIKLNAQAGAIIAKASAEANFTVKLSWDRASRE